jgi:hypothetical protein
MQLRLFAALFLVALVMIAGLHAVPTNNDDYVLDAKGGIDWVCTARCAVWWKCRIQGWFIKKCDQPSGCDCSKFAWEG